jgi:hypothetical protein
VNLDKISDAIARLAMHAADNDGYRCCEACCETERRYLSDQAPALLAEIERLKKFESGELIPGKVVTDNLAAAERWIAEETERCAGICEAMIVDGRVDCRASDCSGRSRRGGEEHPSGGDEVSALRFACLASEIPPSFWERGRGFAYSVDGHPWMTNREIALAAWPDVALPLATHESSHPVHGDLFQMKRGKDILDFGHPCATFGDLDADREYVDVVENLFPNCTWWRSTHALKPLVAKVGWRKVALISPRRSERAIGVAA